MIVRWILLCFGALCIACATNKGGSVLYSDNYDRQKDETAIIIFPYGQVALPGKWTKTHYNSVSGQYFFDGGESKQFAIALQPWDQYEFSKDNPEVTPDNFVRKFFEWDGNYLKEVTKGQIKVINENTEKKFLIWNLRRGDGSNGYFLFGLKDKVAYNLYFESNTWDESKTVSFLEQMYVR